jgi:hypothetical protein
MRTVKVRILPPQPTSPPVESRSSTFVVRKLLGISSHARPGARDRSRYQFGILVEWSLQNVASLPRLGVKWITRILRSKSDRAVTSY